MLSRLETRYDPRTGKSRGALTCVAQTKLTTKKSFWERLERSGGFIHDTQQVKLRVSAGQKALYRRWPDSGVPQNWSPYFPQAVPLGALH